MLKEEMQEELKQLDKQLIYLSNRSRNVSLFDIDEARGYDRDLELCQKKRKDLLQAMSVEEE